jgi:hypothetical protein
MVLAFLCLAPYSAHAHGKILPTETHINLIKYDPKLHNRIVFVISIINIMKINNCKSYFNESMQFIHWIRYFRAIFTISIKDFCRKIKVY